MDDLQILTTKEVLDLTTLSETTLRRWITKRKFPEPVRLGERRIGWPRTQVLDWLVEQRGGEGGVASHLYQTGLTPSSRTLKCREGRPQ